MGTSNATASQATSTISCTTRACLLSGSLHLLFLGAFSGVCWLFTVDTPTAPVRATVMDPPRPRPDPDAARTLDPPIDIDAVEDAPSPVVLEMADDESSSDARDADGSTALGTVDAVTESSSAGTSAFFALGALGQAAGSFGQRTAHGRKRAVAHGGASIASEEAVESALRWFKRHQRADGWWDPACYLGQCAGGVQATIPAARAAPVDANAQGTVAFTGLALLCYLGAGYDHQASSPYTATVARALHALLRAQRPTGGFAGGNYTQAIAALAVIEAYGMSHDRELEAPARRAAQAVLVKQNRDGAARSGWDYGGPTHRDDTSVSGWNAQALVSAEAAGLGSGGDLDQGLAGARGWLEHSWSLVKPEWRYPYAMDGGKISAGTGSLNGVAVTCAYILGGKRDQHMVDALSDAVVTHVPLAYPCNTYGLYYDTIAMFHVGGRRWSHWNESVRDLLVHAQAPGDDCLGGSWEGDTSFCGGPQGRVMATALCCLSLEVYYRYARPHPGITAAATAR